MTLINIIVITSFISTVLFAVWAIIMVEYVHPRREHKLFKKYYIKPMLEHREKMLKRYHNNYPLAFLS